MGLDEGLGGVNFLFHTLFLGGRVDVIVESEQTGTYTRLLFSELNITRVSILTF